MSRIKSVPLGSRFGNLVVLSYAGIAERFHASWNCQCDCGKKTVVLGTHLRRGKTRSCGCLFTTAGSKAHNFKDLSGQTFGRWFVVGPYEIRIRKGSNKKAAYWLCRCSCGRESYIFGGQLSYGSTTKCKWCGARKLPFGESARRTVLQAYKDEAEDRGLSWLIDDATFDLLTKQDCFYCGVGPSNMRRLSDGGSFVYNGIDRVDNSRGYEPDNVVPCCRVCNRAKDVRSKEEFLSWAKRVVEHASVQTNG